MVDENMRKELLTEISQMQDELDVLLSHTPEKNSGALPQIFLITGMLSLVLFFVTVLQESILLQGIALLSYLVATAVFLPLLRVALLSKTPLLQVGGIIGVVILAASFVLLWFSFISSGIEVFFFVLVGLAFIASLLLGFASIMAYMLRKPVPFMTNFFVWCSTLTLLLALWLYQSSVVFLLSLLAVAALVFVTFRQVQYARIETKKLNWLEQKRQEENKK